MSAYLAILKDSFHEAFASRVLWLLLVIATVLLLALLPISITEKSRPQFQSRSTLTSGKPSRLLVLSHAETCASYKVVFQNAPNAPDRCKSRHPDSSFSSLKDRIRSSVNP